MYRCYIQRSFLFGFLFLYLFNFIFFSSFFLIPHSLLLFFPYFSQFYLYTSSFLAFLSIYIYISSRLILLYFQPSFNFLPPCTFLAIARVSSYSVFSISFSSAIFPILSLSFSITLLSLSLYFLSDDPPPPGRVLFDRSTSVDVESRVVSAGWFY